MKIKTLGSIPFEEVMDCFLKAFDGYFVKLPVDLEYWRSRFVIARVDWNLSFGMFDNDQLVGYIINGLDNHNGKFTAYNTGTGVLPEYRGKAIVDQIYAHAIPLLKKNGVEKCLLEVICENERAISVYKRIGFHITRKLRTFSGNLPENPSEVMLQKCHFSEVLETDLLNPGHYAWDSAAEAVKLSGEKLQTYILGTKYAPEAYLVTGVDGNIVQLESKTGDYIKLLSAAGRIFKEVKFKNLDADREELIKVLENLHFSNSVNQYEMEMFL